MKLNQLFELSLTLNTNEFQRVFDRGCNNFFRLEEVYNGEYSDRSLSAKGITIVYRDSQYKKKVRVLVNANLVVDDPSDTDKLVRKLDKRISEYFGFKYCINDFTLSGTTLMLDINVGSRSNVFDYLKVIKRVGKIKGFSSVSYNCFDDKTSFCLCGNSNDIDFLLYDLERAVIGQLRSADADRKQLQSASEQTKGILRTEVRLTKPRAVRKYADAADTSSQIAKIVKNSADVFMDTFIRVIPFGDFYKKDVAVEIVRSKVTDNIMRRRMLRLLTLIPEKKSLHLAQKAMNCWDMEAVMDAFTKINLSPVMISKRHEVKHLENLYSYFLK